MKIKDILGTTKNPFVNMPCPLCTKSEFVDITPGETRISCNTNNVGYRWRCMTCSERNTVRVYEGETGRSARIRGSEHLKDLEKNRGKSVLFKHKISEHPNEVPKFKMEITKSFQDALTRQANEAVRIFGRPGHELLNSKSEFNHPTLGRVVVEKRKRY